MHFSMLSLCYSPHAEVVPGGLLALHIVISDLLFI